MLDLFGSKKKAILALPEFQNIISVVKDLKIVISGMSDEFCIVRASPIVSASETYIRIMFSATVVNSNLRYWLNKYYDMLYGSRPYSFHYNYEIHSRMSEQELQELQKRALRAEASAKETYLDIIRTTIFHDESLLALYEKYKGFGYTDIETLVYNGFHFPDHYCPSPDKELPFSISFTFCTGLSDRFPNGTYKSEYTQREELTYYVQILKSEI